jgi:alanyl-tRNA synthetase
LNYALRRVLLGESATGSSSENATSSLCDQKGSLVDAEKLRFDFSWSSSLTAQQVEEVERIVQEKVASEIRVFAEVVPLAQAMKINSLRAVFGETYPDPVRVVSVGADVQTLINNPSSSEWSHLSIEFCGGTHLQNTQQAESFVIVEETGIAKGIRRIVGLTRHAAQQAKARAANLLERLSSLEKMTGSQELIAAYKVIKVEVDQALVSLTDKEAMKNKLNAIYEVIKVYNKNNLANKLYVANVKSEEVAQEAKNQNKALVVTVIDFGADGKVAKKIHDKLKAVHTEGSFFVISADEDGEK